MKKLTYIVTVGAAAIALAGCGQSIPSIQAQQQKKNSADVAVVQTGMTYSQVQAWMGDPDMYVTDGPNYREWHYNMPNGKVATITFQDGHVESISK